LTNVDLERISSMMHITKAPKLTKLLLVNIHFAESSFTREFRSVVGVARAAQVITSALQLLPQLSVLKLDGLPFIDAAAQQVSAMRGLQSLSVGARTDSASMGPTAPTQQHNTAAAACV
jgi:hypothetical protein